MLSQNPQVHALASLPFWLINLLLLFFLFLTYNDSEGKTNLQVLFITFMYKVCVCVLLGLA